MKRYAGLHYNDAEVRIKSLTITKSKTLMGAGIAYTNYKKKTGMSTFVICPGHLLGTWRKEIEKCMPNGEAVVVRTLSDLQEIEFKIKNKAKKTNLFVIISKDIAKSSFLSQPAVSYSISKNAFVCPDCGRPLLKRQKVNNAGRRGRADYEYVPLNDLDFLKSSKLTNATCMTFNGDGRQVGCGAKLWRPINKFETNRTWFKFGKMGWVYKSHAQGVYDELLRKPTLSKTEKEYLEVMTDHIDKIGTDDEDKGLVAPRKFSIASYIRKRLKGFIDYLIIDECHLYQTSPQNSLQTKAMVDILKASKKSILLTGTLLNGYASGLYYILYNTLPEKMRREGFKYSDENEFVRRYGVIEKKTKTRRARNSERFTENVSSSETKKPGVSPLVFTKFLLENTVFLSLADMSEGLPGYEEKPIFVDMDEELATAYNNVDETMRSLCSFGSGTNGKLLSTLLQLLSVYPDKPYDQSTVFHPDTDEELFMPESLPKGLRNKERETIALIKEKVAMGEKVLLYNEWTKKTDVADKLCKALNEEGINAKIMSSEGKNKVATEDREEWIEKQVSKGLDVLICNPKLVETGLNLLDFTTIIFYQLGYSIFTLRQASRRSYRLSQTKDVEVYFMCYRGTIQETALSLMATKLHAALAIESNFSEEGLRALSDNEDILTKIASNVISGIEGFEDSIKTVKIMASMRTDVLDRARHKLSEFIDTPPVIYSLLYAGDNYKKKKKNKEYKGILNSEVHIGNL